MGAAPPILVVDRDRATRRVVGGLLRRIGYETIEAKTGPEALDLAMRVQPALVILEVNLEEVSGYEVCRELRDAFGSGHLYAPGRRHGPPGLATFRVGLAFRRLAIVDLSPGGHQPMSDAAAGCPEQLACGCRMACTSTTPATS